jgi:hypothetical protein
MIVHFTYADADYGRRVAEVIVMHGGNENRIKDTKGEHAPAGAMEAQ